MTSVCIIEETQNGRGMRIVKVQDRDVLVHAALAAIGEAALRTDAETDPDLALIHQHEARRLFRTLTGLIPELREDAVPTPAAFVGVM